MAHHLLLNLPPLVHVSQQVATLGALQDGVGELSNDYPGFVAAQADGLAGGNLNLGDHMSLAAGLGLRAQIETIDAPNVLLTGGGAGRFGIGLTNRHGRINVGGDGRLAYEGHAQGVEDLNVIVFPNTF